MSDKAGKESQYMISHPELGLDPPIGSDRESGRDKNYVVNTLTDSLYNVYTYKKTAKELWESLYLKYKTKDVKAKKFVVGRFLDYKMVDSKTVVS